MTENQLKLLQIIAKASGETGYADGSAVKKQFGEAFDQTFSGLIQHGFISSEGEVGSISLSPSGWAAVGR